jgi:nickel-dependent lactate racemase
MNCQTHCWTGAWYSDEALTLDFPPEWDVTVFRPSTPPPLTDRQIAEALEQPSGQSPIRQIGRGKSRPLVIVDDLNRPTPVARVMPFLLKHFRDAGISSRDVTILVASGTHGAPQLNAVLKKAGPEAASCKIVLHDPERDLAQVGSTTFGTIVLVNREVMRSDLIVGIGGIYPNHTAGFGGGSKLALGVLGFRSIMELHYRHQSKGWGGGERVNTFRKDLDEIARMIGLNTMISLQVGANREVIRMACGDHFIYYGQEVDFARRVFRAPLPLDANVVISNAYPNDLSVTFVKMKGIAPLDQCAPGASRIAIGSCSEGLGHHGLFPVVNRPRFYRPRHIYRRIAMRGVDGVSEALRGRFLERWGSVAKKTASHARNPIWLYRPGVHSQALPSRVAGFRITPSWEEIVEAVRMEHPSSRTLRVVVYPCAPLQYLDRSTNMDDKPLSPGATPGKGVSQNFESPVQQ